MCGILCHFDGHVNFGDFSGSSKDTSSPTSSSDPVFQGIVPSILERGSDYSEYYSKGHFEWFSSVLSLRQPICKQPIKGSKWTIQFNGELYNSKTLQGNDTEYLARQLDSTDGDVVDVIRHLDGEFAYCIVEESQKIHFGKDRLGKRALGFIIEEGKIYVSSCPPKDHLGFVECKPGVDYTYIDGVVQENSWWIPEIVGFPGDEYQLEQLQATLCKAVEKRVTTIHPFQGPSSLAILFSGGIDCTLLAAMACQYTNARIDLLNVSFGNPRSRLDPSETPDRKLALRIWGELCHKYGYRFNLVEVDVPYEEYLAHKQKVIDLIYPNDTAMDLSISIAFYFASGGRGNSVGSDGVRKPYQSKCKVLLSGLGADELFGGYTRHEKIYTFVSNQSRRQIQGKPPKDTTEYDMEALASALRNELQHDLSNLWIRNLSRDDKVISCWSKEVRYPYLDDDVVRFGSRIKLADKLRYNVETGGITRKWVLRGLARKMGLDWVADEPKRAIQFGAKSAKMEVGSGQSKGTDKL